MSDPIFDTPVTEDEFHLAATELNMIIEKYEHDMQDTVTMVHDLTLVSGDELTHAALHEYLAMGPVAEILVMPLDVMLVNTYALSRRVADPPVAL